MSSDPNDTFEQILYDRLTLVRKEKGDYSSVEYIYQNIRLFLNLYPTRTKRVFVGKDEDGDFYFFRFERKEVSVFKRKYEL